MADSPEDPQPRVVMQGSFVSRGPLSRAWKTAWTALAIRVRSCTAFIAVATMMASTAILPLHGTATAQNAWQQSDPSGHALNEAVGTSESSYKPQLMLTPLDSSIRLQAVIKNLSNSVTISGWQYSRTTGASASTVDATAGSVTTPSWRDIPNSSDTKEIIHTVDDLTNGTLYLFKVRVVFNTTEYSLASDPVSAIPGPPPEAPRLSATPGNGSINLEASIDDTGGIDITGWQYKQKTDARWVTIPDSNKRVLMYTISKLVNGRAYTYEVRAVNSIGNGAVSEITVTPGLPVKPTLSVTAGDNRVTLSMAVSATGGIDITKWQYRRKTSNASTYDPWIDIDNRSTSLNHTISNLNNGTTYSFQVRASNLTGNSPESDEVVATPAAVPPKPTLSFTVGSASVSLSASVSSTNGSDITKWEYRWRTSNNSTYSDWIGIANSNSTSATHTISNLANGTTYSFQVRASNSIGASPASDEVTATPSSPSQTPAQAPPQTPSQTSAQGLQDYFVDDDGNVHERNINFAASEGITVGCNTDGTHYCPDEPVTRAQMASFMARTHNLKPPTGQTGVAHVDVTSTTHGDNIRAIAHHGITLGCNADGTRYCPDDLVTRAQMASFIARSFNLTLPRVRLVCHMKTL